MSNILTGYGISKFIFVVLFLYIQEEFENIYVSRCCLGRHRLAREVADESPGMRP